MKKFIIFLFFLSVLVSLSAQEDIFLPPHPIAFGLGGARTADPEGLSAFFYNPAGFASEQEEMTFASTTAYALINHKLLEYVLDLAGGDAGGSRNARRGISKIPGFDQEDLDDLAKSFEGFEEWIEDLEEDEQDAAVKAAVKKIIDLDEDLAEQIPEEFGGTGSDDYDDGDDNGLPIPSSLIEAILQSPIFEEDGNGDTNLVAIIDAMNEGVREHIEEEVRKENEGVSEEAIQELVDEKFAEKDIANDKYLAENWKKDINDVVRDNFDSIPGGDARVGALASIAYVGNGLGLGLFVGAEAKFSGEPILATRGHAVINIILAAGYAFPIGPVTIGAQLRPTILGYTEVNPISVLLGKRNIEELLEQNSLYTGLYVGVDVGALFDVGSLLDLDAGMFTLGLTLKDILPIPIAWTSYSGFKEYLTALERFELLGTDTVSPEIQKDLYTYQPFRMNFGLSLNTDLNPDPGDPDLFGLKFNADIQDFFGMFGSFFEGEEGLFTVIMDHLHLGLEFSFLGDFGNLRLGYGDSFLTAGLGLNLFILDINMAGGISDIHINNDGDLDFNQLGATVEIAIRL